MMLHTVAFVSAIIIFQQFSQLPSQLWLLPLVLAFFFFVWRQRKICAWFLFGFVWAFMVANVKMADRLDSTYEGMDIQVEGVVISIPEPFQHGTRFLFQIDSVPDKGIKSAVPEKIKLSWYRGYSAVRAGERWALEVRLKRPNGTLNPGGFDYEGWLFRKGIGAVGYVRKSEYNRIIGEEAGLFTALSRFRQALAEQIETVLADRGSMGIVQALAIGTRKNITFEQWEMLRKTGTAHLVAISGLHIGLVAGLLFFAVKWSLSIMGVTRIAPYQLAAPISVCGALMYAALAGFSLPTQRALIMVTVIMFALALKREVLPLHVLSIALLMVIFIDPLAVSSASFWLSFSAVSLIIYLSAGRIHAVDGVLKKQRIHFVLALGLAPLLLFFFQQVSIVAPIANFIAVPVVGLVIVPLILLALVTSYFMVGLSTFLLKSAGYCLDWLTVFLQAISQWSLADWSVANPSLLVTFLAMIGVLVVFSPGGFPARWLGAMMLLPMVFVRQPAIVRGDFTMTLLDVGQGLSVVVQTAEHLLVFDAGARYGGRFDMGAMVVSPFIKSIGYSEIDKFLISHGDIDHRGGAKSVAAHFSIGEITSSAPEIFDWAEISECMEGESWRWDNVTFRILNPAFNSHLSDNNRSCVLQISSLAGSVLLTGDIEKQTERRLVKEYGDSLQSDVVIVPHHGSKTSSLEVFINRVNPDYALFPVGYRNRFGFPIQSVIERYQERGVILMDTASHGAITMRLKRGDDVANPESFRLQSGRYWNR